MINYVWRCTMGRVYLLVGDVCNLGPWATEAEAVEHSLRWWPGREIRRRPGS